MTKLNAPSDDDFSAGELRIVAYLAAACMAGTGAMWWKAAGKSELGVVVGLIGMLLAFGHIVARETSAKVTLSVLSVLYLLVSWGTKALLAAAFAAR